MFDLKDSFSKLKVSHLIGYYLLVSFALGGIEAIFELATPANLLPEASAYFFGSLPWLGFHLTYIWVLMKVCHKLDIPLSIFYQAPISKTIFTFILYFFVPLSLGMKLLVLGQDYIFNGFSYLPFAESSGINPTGAWIINASESFWYLLFNLMSTLQIAVITPIFEEFFFRGLILHRLLAKYSAGKAIFFSALIFGAFHLHGFLHSFFFGLFLGFVYLQTKSLRDVALWHILQNGLAMYTIVMSTYNGDGYIENPHTFFLLGAGLFSLVSLPLGISWLRKKGSQPEAAFF